MKKTYIFFSIFLLVFIITVNITVVMIKNFEKEETLISEQNILDIYGDRISKKSSYNNPIVPNGFKKVETDTASWELENGIPKGWNNGLVIEDSIGNQFVWVPCEIAIDLHSTKIYNGIIDGRYNEKEFLQLINYEGFYISRYEAGLSNEIIDNTTEFSNITNNIEGTPLSQKDKIVWNFIDWNTAKKNATLMYSKDDLSSDLPTIQQYKEIGIWLSNNEEINIADSNNYGNYSNTTFNFTGYYSNDYGKTYQYAKNEAKKSQNILLSTGAFERNKTNNIYDLAGNVAEFLDVCKIASNKKIRNIYYCIGGYYDNVSTYSITSTIEISTHNSLQGFRIVLYQN